MVMKRRCLLLLSVAHNIFIQCIEAGADVKTRMIRDELGEMASIYETVARVKGMSPVQARMEIMKVDM